MLTRRRRRPAQERAPGGLLANSSALMASRLVKAALGWAGTVLIARSLSLEQFGAFTLIFTVLGLMSVVTDMGIGRIAIRGMLGDRGRDPGAFAGSYIALRSVMGLVGYGVALLVVWLSGYPTEVVQATAIAGLVVVVSTPSHALDVVFQARMRMGTVGAADAGGVLVQLALTAAIAAAGGSLLLFTIPAVVYELVVLAWKFPVAHRLVRIRLRVEPRVWGALIREALPLSVGFGLATIYQRVDSLMLSHLVGFDAVGIYGVSYKFIDIVHFAATAVTVPLLTLLVQAWPDDMPGFRDALRRGALLLGLIAGVAMTGLLGFAHQVTRLLYGTDYVAGADTTRVLVLGESLTFMISLSLACLVAAERHRHYPLVMLGGLVLNVSVNLWLIPLWSYLGAAVATVVTEAVILTVLVLLLLRLPGVRPLRVGRLLVVAPAVALAVGVGWVADRGLPWVLAAMLAMLTYLAVVSVGGLTDAAGLDLRRRAGRLLAGARR